MKSLYQLVFISLTFFVISCSSDPCDDISCFNGGICTEGMCDCPAGWTGADCSIFDFEYIGRYESLSFERSNCNDASSNGSFSANSDGDYCTAVSTDELECFSITLILEEDNAARFVQVNTQVTPNLRFSRPTLFRGTFTTDNEIITFTDDEGGTPIMFRVKDDRSGVEWVLNSSTSGCAFTHDMLKS